MDVQRKALCIQALLADEEHRLSPVQLGQMQSMTLDAVLFLLTGAQPQTALRALGQTVTQIAAALKQELEQRSEKASW